PEIESVAPRVHGIAVVREHVVDRITKPAPWCFAGAARYRGVVVRWTRRHRPPTQERSSQRFLNRRLVDAKRHAPSALDARGGRRARVGDARRQPGRPDWKP